MEADHTYIQDRLDSQRLQYLSDRDHPHSQRITQLEIIDQAYENNHNQDNLSKTTYESCSSFGSEDSHQDQVSEDESKSNSHNNYYEQTKQDDPQQTIETEDAPIQNKTLKLSSIKEGKLIYFEEYDPIHQSYRNEALMTGGRGTSCASNRFSLSKTINFNMAFLNADNKESAKQDQELSSLNSSIVDINNQKSALNELLISQLSQQDKQNMGTQTQESRNQQPKEAALSDNAMNKSYNIDSQYHMFPLSARVRQHSYRAQSQDTNSSPFSKHEQTVTYLNQSLQRHTQNHNSLLMRSSAVQNRVKHHQQAQVQQNPIQRAFTYTNDDSSNHKHERKWSESSSNQNQLSQCLNGQVNVSFSKTMNLVNANTKTKRKEDELQDLKYLLENVQCEAKNLKLLLNLKDDQLHLYESKTEELQSENEEIHREMEEMRSKIEIYEEENIYLRAIANSNQCETIIHKSNVGILTEKVSQDHKQCQVSIQQPNLQHKLNIALSPIRMQFSPQKINNAVDNQKHLKIKKQLADAEKENVNLMNKLNCYIEKCKKQELDYNILQTDYNQSQKENAELRRQMQQEHNNLYWQLDNHKAQLSDQDKKMREMFQLLEDSKHQTKKKSSKIKSLKKERDVLKIEILKLKQIYSEKCDNYKEVRTKLQKKLKKREHTINKLEDKLTSYEQQYKKSNNQSKAQLPVWAQEVPVQDFESSNQFMKSSMRSRSLENTGNFNSTAKHHIKNMHQNLPVRDVSKELQVQNYIDQTPNQNKYAVPQYYGAFQNQPYDDYFRHQKPMKFKTKHADEDKARVPSYPQTKANYPTTHFVSGDKSKSFYSSEFDNNTLFDPNQIIMEDQSNSSNYYSNINSNSHLFIDESALMSDKNLPYGQQPQTEMKYKKQSNQQLIRNASSNQIKPSNIPLPQYSGDAKKENYQQNKLTVGQALNKQANHLSSQKRRNNSNILSQNHTPVNHSYLSSLQPDDLMNQSHISNNNIPQRCVAKSPLCKSKAQKPQDSIPRNRSSQNLTQGEGNPQNSIRNHQPADSNTSSNRNLNQPQKVGRPSSSSTNNTTTIHHHNQAAAISYQSSSSGGSKHYHQQKLQMPYSFIQSYQPQVKQSQVLDHKRQRSKCLENEAVSENVESYQSTHALRSAYPSGAASYHFTHSLK